MKVLWLSNVRLITDTINKSGTWIHSMFHMLNNYKDIEIVGNVTIGNVPKPLEIISKDRNFREFIIPTSALDKHGFPPQIIENEIIIWIDNIKADIIHVWGIELFWGTLLNKVKFTPSIVEIQGIKSITSENIFFDAGLDAKVLNNTGILEFMYPSLKHSKLKKSFKDWEATENVIFSSTKCINTQSDWVRQVISNKTNTSHTIYNTGIILRDEFTNSSVWSDKHIPNTDPIIFSLSAPRVYKGIHTTIEAFALVKKKFPTAKLRIAGISLPKRKLLYSSYLKYIDKLLRKLDIRQDVEFLGNLESIDIVTEMYKCDVYVNTSFIETYCLSLAEAMALGVPCVASYTSALRELIIDNEDGMLFPLGDKYTCSSKIISLLNSRELQTNISGNASKKIRSKSDAFKITENQIAIYKDVLSVYDKS